MKNWVSVKQASQILGISISALYTNRHDDKKKNWNRRFKTLNGELLVNIADYRGKATTNQLTKKRIQTLYYELMDFLEDEKLLCKKVKALLPQKNYADIREFFEYFSFKKRKPSLEYYWALKQIYKEEIC